MTVIFAISGIRFLVFSGTYMSHQPVLATSLPFVHTGYSPSILLFELSGESGGLFGVQCFHSWMQSQEVCAISGDWFFDFCVSFW